MFSFFTKKSSEITQNTPINSKQLSPIFIIGVLRSGTTLLRVILDSHSKIAAPSETPWILGGYGENSIRQLSQFLATDQYGPVKNLPGINEKTIMQATRSFLTEIFAPLIYQDSKQLLVLKTPQDIKYLEYLLELYPDSKYLHIFRDGRDSSCSLVENVSKVFGAIDDYGELNHLNAFKRWYDWEVKIRALFKKNDRRKYMIKYEDLVTDPSHVLKGVCNFIGVDFEPDMLNYNRYTHNYPEWEAGTHDLRNKKNIDDSSIGRWRTHFSEDETSYVNKHYGKFLNSLGYS